MIGYKLTDQNSQTRDNTQWGENVTHEISPDKSGDLCSSAWLHFYQDPLLAILHNPIHADIQNPILWKCEAEEEILHDGMIKSGCKKLTTIEKIVIPNINLIQKVAYGILATKEVYGNENWNKWADNWLSGKDRSADAADAADAAAYAAAYAAYAAYAADAAYAAYAAYAADAAAYAAARAADAADAAADAAAYAAYAAANLDLISIAKKAMQIT